ncbi:MAG: extensin family protein [Myxococcales bacterium]|nr:extensin family protein [Myxococcales bacterium]
MRALLARHLVLAFALLAAGACATPDGARREPLRVAAARAPAALPEPLPPPLRRASDSIPGGITCLLKLRALAVPFRELAAIPWVDTPVEITGPVGGVELLPMGKLRARCDCRLALALARAAPLFRALGVQALYFSNAYSKRPIRRGKISRHRMGLAIDVHRVRVGGAVLRVQHDYRRGQSGPCSERDGALNRLACELRARRLFEYVLTPDTNAAHYNHFHFSILSLDRRRRLSRRRPYPIVTD